ncbi:hypothetical protein K431DRAFT_336833 [Polychaeton citri CBS 116435]|uniref:Uncharacterized protein n=1 Tax=Polychaeton citri CBS 116435 TaxID=1314669 RepID=A0A9P4UTC5_9PEZI|nr:hypothetical protein K431DRAFT_336833 [Polychaeton citri CBS 116435]
MTSASTQSTLQRLQAHVAGAITNPHTPLDIVLPNHIAGDHLLGLIQQLSILLPQLQQDPTPAATLLTKLLDGFSFADVLAFDPPVDFCAGLQVGNYMASLNPADAATVASKPDVFLAIVRLWLCTTDTGVATQAFNVFVDLLKVDHAVQVPDSHIPRGGQGLVWKRVFSDPDIYSELFKVCSLNATSEVELSNSQKTVAQARLLEWIPVVAALDWNAVTRSHNIDIESRFKASSLLDFAASHMVDIKSDVLMYRCLIDFYSELLDATKPSRSEASSRAASAGLEYLITSGAHERTAAIFVQKPGVELDLIESMYLYGPAANYVAAYASTYHKHFLDSELQKEVHLRLMKSLTISPSKWAHGETPKHDLHVLASIPRSALLPGHLGAGDWSQSPLSLLPSKLTAPEVLSTLATVFHGPEQDTITYPLDSPMINFDSLDSTSASEGAAARAVYYHYIANNPRFWDDLAAHADTVALKELALASLQCFMAVATASWPVEQTIDKYVLPSSIAAPESATLALLTPPALENTLPYLFRPPRTFANLVGGRGDVESAAYKIATMKFDVLRVLRVRLASLTQEHPEQAYEDILSTIDKRLSDGPFSREGEIGGRIGTLEL